MKKVTQKDLEKGTVVRFAGIPDREWKLMLVGTVCESLSSPQGLKRAEEGSKSKTVKGLDPAKDETCDILVLARWVGEDTWSNCGTTSEFKWHWFLESEEDTFVREVCKIAHALGFCAFGRCSL